MSQPTIEQIRAKEQANKTFTEWRRRTAKGMPALANRVFALRGRFYMGCGFHYALEKDLGVCIARLNDYDTDYYHGPEAMPRQVTAEVIVEELYRRVVEAEKSADEFAAKRAASSEQEKTTGASL